MKNSLPDLSTHTISQSIRYILTSEDFDILAIALKDNEELGLEIKDQNGTNLLTELKEAENQLKSVVANKEKLEKNLEEILDYLSTTNSSATAASVSINEANKILETLKSLVESNSSLKDKLVFFNNPDGTYSGRQISFFLNKNVEDISLSAIPALQTFITDHDITLSSATISSVTAASNETSEILETLKSLVESNSSLKDKLVFFNKPNGTYSGCMVSSFLDKNVEDISLSAISALQTFIDTTLSGESTDYQI